MTNPKIEYTTDYKARLKKLTHPTKEDSFNSLVVSNIIRELEIAMILPDAEKQLEDSELIQKSIGRNLIFIAEVAKCYDNGEIDFINLTVVGEVFGVFKTPLRTSMSSLVAEKIRFNITEFTFEQKEGKILPGTTFLFSAYVAKDLNNMTYLTTLRVIEFGLKTFDKDGGLESIISFQLNSDTFNFENYIVEKGQVFWNPFRNPTLNKHIQRYNKDKKKEHLHRAFEKVLNLYDIVTITDREKLSKIL